MARKVSFSRLFQVFLWLNAVLRCQDQRTTPLPQEHSYVEVIIVFNQTNNTVTTGTYFSG